jgi:hypothetical protein
MFLGGILAMALLLPGPRPIGGGVGFDIHTLLYAAVAVIIGVQSIQFWVFAKIYGMREGLVPPDPWFSAIISAVARIENGLIAGGVLLLLGLALGIYALGSWDVAGFGALRPSDTMRLVIPSAVAIILAFQTAYGAFFISVLEVRASRSAAEAASSPAARAA